MERVLRSARSRYGFVLARYESNGALVRYGTDGILDTTFSGRGDGRIFMFADTLP